MGCGAKKRHPLEQRVYRPCFEDKLFDFVKLVLDDTAPKARLMNTASMVKHLYRAPQNALIGYTVLAYVNRCSRYLMDSNFDHGKKRQDSWSDFNECSGFQRVATPPYEVPLRAMGRAVFRSGLYHHLRERFPAPLAIRPRDLRESWYEPKCWSVTEGL